MLRFLIDCNIVDELGNRENEESLSEIIENILKRDNRVVLVGNNNSHIFYRESDKENLIKDYPELAQVIKDDDSLETFLEWKYQTEDDYIETISGSAKITLNNEYLKQLETSYLEEYSDDTLFSNLESILRESEERAKQKAIREALIDLMEAINDYTDDEAIEFDTTDILGAI